MKLIPESFNKSNIRATIIFLALSTIFLIIAFIIGINDNPPGIFLVFLGSILLLLAFVHHWKNSTRFKKLTISSLIGIVVFVVLHNLFDALSQIVSKNSLSQNLFVGIDVIFFLLAIFICPAGIIIGAWGWISKKNN